jgi:ankyrin repeat protein
MAIEQPDKLPVVANVKLFEKANKSTFQREIYGYTPLMLAVAGGDGNIDIVKALLNAKADWKKTDEFGNNLLHIAAMNSNNKTMEFIAKTLKLDIIGRNKAGETALLFCQTNKNQDGVDLLNNFTAKFDKSNNAANDLLKALEDEEEFDKEAKSKKKDKKWRNKINKIAKAEGISTEEVEKRLKEEAE